MSTRMKIHLDLPKDVAAVATVEPKPSLSATEKRDLKTYLDTHPTKMKVVWRKPEEQ